MSLKKVHDDQPDEFQFSIENLENAKHILKKYPEKNKNGIAKKTSFFCSIADKINKIIIVKYKKLLFEFSFKNFIKKK